MCRPSRRSISPKRSTSWAEKASNSPRNTIYSDLTPRQITKIARHPERPYTLDYVSEIFTDFVELHLATGTLPMTCRSSAA